MDIEGGEWLTYAEVGDRLGITPEAARSRAKRLGWRRQLGNDGRAKVLTALTPRPPGDHPASPPGRKVATPDNDQLIKALGDHVETLKLQLATAEAALAAERAQTAKAIDAFVALADRLDQLAAERARPWWRRRSSA